MDTGEWESYIKGPCPTEAEINHYAEIIPDCTTTLMFRYIPRRFTAGDVVAELDHYVTRMAVNFVYVPWYKLSPTNMGYAFVNFTNTTLARIFMAIMEQAPRRSEGFRHYMKVEPAHVQGLGPNVLRHGTGAASNRANCTRIFHYGVPIPLEVALEMHMGENQKTDGQLVASACGGATDSGEATNTGGNSSTDSSEGASRRYESDFTGGETDGGEVSRVWTKHNVLADTSTARPCTSNDEASTTSISRNSMRAKKPYSDISLADVSTTDDDRGHDARRSRGRLAEGRITNPNRLDQNSSRVQQQEAFDPVEPQPSQQDAQKQLHRQLQLQLQQQLRQQMLQQQQQQQQSQNLNLNQSNNQQLLLLSAQSIPMVECRPGATSTVANSGMKMISLDPYSQLEARPDGSRPGDQTVAIQRSCTEVSNLLEELQRTGLF